jgi:hypothetical protein
LDRGCGEDVDGLSHNFAVTSKSRLTHPSGRLSKGLLVLAMALVVSIAIVGLTLAAFRIRRMGRSTWIRGVILPVTSALDACPNDLVSA